MKLKLKNNILRDIDTIARESHSIYEAKFQNHNLKRGQFLFLTRVCENPGISLGQLSYQLKMDKTTITKAIQKLIIAGYVNKEIDQKDHRLSHLKPTAKALEIYNEIISEKNRIIEVCLKGIKDEDTSLLNKLIETILKNINKEWDRIIDIKN